MDIYSLIETEDTDSLYDRWNKYRNNLTDYIIECIEDFHIKRKLAETGKKRIYGEYEIENIVKEHNKKPTLAIWGAGGCNDIDVKRLAKYFKLCLIDTNTEKINQAKERFMLGDDECICVDLKFWDIDMDTYEMFDAMLKDGENVSAIRSFFEDMIRTMGETDYNSLPNFDYSVAIGLVSQLNSRFAALVHVNEYAKDLSKELYELNKIAVERFLFAVNKMTDKVVMLGYELACQDDINPDINEICTSINEESQIYLLEGNKNNNFRNFISNVAGNDILIEKTDKWQENNNLSLVNYKAFIWPFTKNKDYLMLVDIWERK